MNEFAKAKKSKEWLKTLNELQAKTESLLKEIRSTYYLSQGEPIPETEWKWEMKTSKISQLVKVACENLGHARNEAEELPELVLTTK